MIFVELTLDGLSRGSPDGSSLPVLAAEVPTQANGDVSPDGTVVTWKLKPGVTWSDGQPFTSHDVVFTYQMIMDPANPVINRSDYAVMDSVTAPDDNTVVITYKTGADQLGGMRSLAIYISLVALGTVSQRTPLCARTTAPSVRSH